MTTSHIATSSTFSGSDTRSRHKYFQGESLEKNLKLVEKLEDLHKLAKALLVYETLSGEEIKDLIKGIKPTRDDFDNDINTPKKPATSVPKTGGSATAPAN